MDELQAIKSEKMELELTLGEIDELFKAGQAQLERARELVSLRMEPAEQAALESALQKMDELVNG